MIRWILIIVFFVYGIPVWKLRYQFRSAVYNDASWQINFRPWFVKETHALFTNKYFSTTKERALARNYRIYMLIYTLLFLTIIFYPE